MPREFNHIIRLFLLVLGTALLTATQTLAQALKPEGRFQADSLKVGEPVAYVLTFRYPRDLEVVFPDENHAYAPFEYLDRTFYPTRTDSINSFDSVVYTLTTFELDSIQSLALPVYVINTGENGRADSTVIYAEEDAIFLQRLITQTPDSLALKQNTEFRLVDLQFNYPYLLAGIAALVLIVVLIYVLFGKKIRQRWQIYRLQKDNKKFQEQFNKAVATLQGSPDRRRMEETLIVWKKYMEKLDRTPYTKMTTKEISRLPAGEPLQDDLRTIDRGLYSRSSNGELISRFDHLYQYTDDRFKQRIEEIKHAK